MRKIVIPSDFSPNAFNALKYAVELFKDEECEFYLLHAFAEEVYNDEDALTSETIQEVKANLKEKYEKRLKDKVEKILKHSQNPLHKFETVAPFGYLIDEINELVNKVKADLVVMGTRGKTNNADLTFGSNTLQVIKYIQAPVLSIPENYKFRELHNILFPTNFMLPYQTSELKLVADIGRSFNADLHMLYISNFNLESLRQKENLKLIKEKFEGNKFHYHQIYGEERAQVINEQIEHFNIDLLVMVNSRYTYLENILFESTIDKISLYPRIPFMILQNFHRDNW
ncbi:MAG TPA: universal stress protein [Gillisia sp.]|nr:universal stress protein [Gillisia sp.]